MASLSSVHSNAFNFLSSINNSVDPRTGQYSLAIELPTPAGNDLIGPHLPLRLAFNPLNNEDTGFGTGWNLTLTQYVPGTHMLTLHTGESFKVTGSGPMPSIREKKLDTFHFHDDSAGGELSYRVVHKSGLVEVLKPFGDTDPVALPVQVFAATGHAITLTYILYQGNYCLESIVDGNARQLLKVSYSASPITLDLHPGSGPDGAPYARYVLELRNRQLIRVKLPTDVGSWRFEYDFIRDKTCLKKLWTPVGGIEDIFYEDQGHQLPGRPDSEALPRVTTHLVSPAANQPQLKTTYTYTHFDVDSGVELDNNFVGLNSDISWSDDGEDYLFRADASYRYSVTAHHWLGEQVVRKRTLTYNRHHLMTLQILEQDGHIEETETVFHEIPDTDFDYQPAKFQLPHTITKRWKLRGDASKLRVETATTDYDEHGNLVEEIQPTGIRSTYEYYAAEGEEDENSSGSWHCPPDPHGFVRSLKSMTIHPVAGLAGDAPILRSRLTYRAYPPLSSAGDAPDWLAPSKEKLLRVITAYQEPEQEQLLQLSENNHLDKPTDLHLHGRPDFLATTRYGSDTEDPLRRAIESRCTRTEWRYRKEEHPTHGLEFWTDETITGFDLVQKTTRQASSPLHGQTTYKQDDFANAVRLSYDALGRLMEEIVAPDSVDETRTTYGYSLVDAIGENAMQWVTDSAGVTTYLTMDGLSRVVTEEREIDAEEPADEPRTKYLISEVEYDGLGQKIGETTYDHYDGRVVTLKSTFEYNTWGDLCKTTLPSGMTLHSERSPFGEQGDLITSWMETPDKPGVRQQQQVVQTNRFDKPAWHHNLDSNGAVTGRQTFAYDGHGQSVRDERTLKRPGGRLRQRRTGYRYDEFGRITRTERPDRSAVIRKLALHSSNELTEHLQVQPRNATQPQLAWDRTFDGIERLDSLSAGLRRETFAYQADTSLIETRTTAAGRTFAYTYQPTRSSQPESIQVNGRLSNFDYDPSTAAITTASNDQGTRTYRYTSQGYLRWAEWEDATGDRYRCDYSSSLQGLPLGYRDSDGVEVSHTYDDLGRLETTTQGDLQASFTYDPAGRLETVLTKDLANGQSLYCVHTYDDFGREDSRCLTLTRSDGSTLSQQITQVWREDEQLHSRTLSREGVQVLLETFDYDVLDRLEHHTCEGTMLPRNAQGREIVSQFFVYDALDNLCECYTDFADGQVDEAFFTYEGFLLCTAEHSLQPDYPAFQRFTHDDDGNLLNDEWGNRLVYDDAGRLSEVRSADGSQSLYQYRFDGHDELVGVRQGSASEVLRRYQGYQVSSTLEDDVLTQYLYAGDRPLGSQQSSGAAHNQLLLTDPANSVIAESSATTLHETRYSAYGERPGDGGLQGLLGFTGQACEQALGWYLLGSGYRAYNPGLMRFHSPDALLPEAAGINPYAYCGGNPVNWKDPTGHFAERSRMEYANVPVPPAPKRKLGVFLWLGIAGLALSLIALPNAGSAFAFAAAMASATIDAAAIGTSVRYYQTGDERLGKASEILSIASTASSLALTGFQITRRIVLVWKTPPHLNGTPKVNGMPKVDSSLLHFNNRQLRAFRPRRPQFTDRVNLDWDVMPPTQPRTNIRNRIFKPDVPQSSIGSVTTSNSGYAAPSSSRNVAPTNTIATTDKATAPPAAKAPSSPTKSQTIARYAGANGAFSPDPGTPSAFDPRLFQGVR